ncbi:MAG: polysaccharide biosynthesis/export family protein [Coleofasciculaceae cyanobacterium]
MNLQSEQNKHQSFPRWHRWSKLSIASLYMAASTFSGTALLWLTPNSVSANTGTGQTVADLPTLPQPREDIEELSSPTSPGNGLQENPRQLVFPSRETSSSGELNFPEEPPPIGFPEQLPVPSSTDGQFSRYRLGPGDSLQVQVQGFPDLSFNYGIDIQGNIVVPLLGKINVADRTVEEVQAEIRIGLDQFIVDPKVTVVVSGFRQAEVTVTGEVFKPGYYTLNPGAKLDEALLAAGGATNDADLRAIVVRRRSLAQGSIAERKVDLFTPLQNGAKLPDLQLQDGDAVIVLRLDSENVTDYDRTLASRSSFAQPNINIRVLNYANAGGGRVNNIALPNGSSFVDAFTAINPNADDANLRKIALIRFDPERGKAVAQEIDGKGALLGDVSQNVPLQNNDVIVIGRNLIAKILFGLNTITRPFRDFLGFSGFLDELTDQFGSTNTDGN